MKFKNFWRDAAPTTINQCYKIFSIRGFGKEVWN